LGEVLTLLTENTGFVANNEQLPRNWIDTLVRAKMDLEEVGCGGMDWIDLAQDRDRWRALLNAVMNLGVT
jgi:hypothetical protein